jgi:mitochondrial fission protein ELM1
VILTDAPAIWVLADDRPGNVAQCLGVAEALGEPFRVITVRYNAVAGWHNLLIGAHRHAMTRASRSELTPPWPKLVIAAGRRTAPLALWLKRRHGAKLVQIMDPGWPGRAKFDLIAAPRHDAMAEAANVIHTLGSCHRASPALLQAEAAKWQKHLAHLPRPWLVLSVGGATKDYDFPAFRAEQMMAQTLILAKSQQATILAATSRRSGPKIEAVIRSMLPEGSYFHPWQEGAENPYLGFIALADCVVATGDSMNMCSEACANGGPVYLFCPPNMVNDKHARLHDLLFEQGYARPLGDSLTPWRHPHLNAAEEVAGEVRRRGLMPGHMP